ncbi:hypothetical protein [Parafrankia sp. FMc2]|uniref:hypothetical protein n=1 Tax=Parafrankia sp. FMc2 TaxID=3233196 RepID=UPI0034D54314
MAWNHMQVQIDHLWGPVDVIVGLGSMSRQEATDAVQEILDRLVEISPETARVAAETWRRGTYLEAGRRGLPVKEVYAWYGDDVDLGWASTSWEIYEYPDGADPGRAAAALFDDSLLTDSEEGDGHMVFVHRSLGIEDQVEKIPTLEWLREQEPSTWKGGPPWPFRN